MIALKALREAAGKYGEYLTQEDADHANECLSKYGYTEESVLELAAGWAHEYARVAWCETREAERYEDNYR